MTNHFVIVLLVGAVCLVGCGGQHCNPPEAGDETQRGPFKVAPQGVIEVGVHYDKLTVGEPERSYSDVEQFIADLVDGDLGEPCNGVYLAGRDKRVGKVDGALKRIIEIGKKMGFSVYSSYASGHAQELPVKFVLVNGKEP